MANRIAAVTENRDFEQSLKCQGVIAPEATQRNVLSVLQSNVHQWKHTDKVQKKNVSDKCLLGNSKKFQVPKVLKAPKFTIFSDEKENVADEKENVADEKENLQDATLSEIITNLYKNNEHEEILENNSKNDSFMVLDLSTNGKRAELDILYNSPYCNDIYQYLREVEQKFQPRATYMRKQPDITITMRSVLVDWLVEVAEEYKLHAETLYLAVSYIDRFLSCMSVLRGKLQLVGTACMFIAAKYEEIYPPELKDFVYVTDDTYSKKQILRMEHLILRVLAFDLSTPTAYIFLQHFCTILKRTEKVCFLSQYICELSLLEAEPFLKFLPSEIAAAALILANYTLDCDPWSECYEQLTGYKLNNLTASINALFKRYSSVATYPQQAIYEKYKSARFLCVANISPPEHLMSNMMQQS